MCVMVTDAHARAPATFPQRLVASRCGGGSGGCGCVHGSVMQAGGIPEPVRHFLTTHFHSIEQLELLLLLRATADRAWSAADVSRELGSSVMSMRDRLGDLAARGFVTGREAGADLLYSYAPSTEEVSRLIDGLASAYKERRLTVINLIYAKPESDAVSFSEAFKLSRKKRDQ